MKRIFFITILTISFLYSKNEFFTDMPRASKIVMPRNNQVILSFYDAIKDVKKSVVNISTTKKVKVSRELEQLFNHPLFKEFFGLQLKKHNDKEVNSLGSGVIISKDGYIITNNHVIADAHEIFVNIPGRKKTYRASLIGTDSKTDIAVIKIKANNLTIAKLANSSNLREGDIVFAIGNPFGIGESITQGIISALNKRKVGLNQYENFIQTDASINPGNSGGALTDTRGALIGINSAIMSKSGGNNGIGFAIPVNMVKNIAGKLIRDGKVQRGYLGVNLSDLTPQIESLYKHKRGALILNVLPQGAAYKAKLRRGDLILSIGNENIYDTSGLRNAIASYSPNERIPIIYERNGEIKKSIITLGSRDKLTPSYQNREIIEGLKVSELTNRIRKRLRIPHHIQGLIVTKVRATSYSSRVGFHNGDIILQVDEFEIDSIKRFKYAIKNSNPRTREIFVSRNGYVIVING